MNISTIMQKLRPFDDLGKTQKSLQYSLSNIQEPGCADQMTL